MTHSLETIHFYSEGRRCVGHLRIPEQASEDIPGPAVCFCAGMSLTKEVWLPEQAKRLADAGFVTLNFDYRGFGESEGEPRRRLLPAAQVRDVQNALTWLASDPRVDGSRLGLSGTSLGASVAVGVSGKDARVKALCAVAGPMDLERVWRNFDGYESFRQKVQKARNQYVRTGEVSYISTARLLAGDPETAEHLRKEVEKYERWNLDLAFESLLDLFDFRPEAVVHQIRGAGLFMVPEHEGVIAQMELHSAFAKAPEPRRLVVIDGAKHVDVYGTGDAFERVVSEQLNWFKEYLGN